MHSPLAPSARAKLDLFFAELYAELRRVASAHRRRWWGNETLDTSALVHEAYLKLALQKQVGAQEREHVLSLAARAMRHVLINYAQARNAAKRGGGWQRVDLERVAGRAASLDDLVATCELLEELERHGERLARIVECRVLAGLTVDETAQALSVSSATVRRDWTLASAWLYRELGASRRGA